MVRVLHYVGKMNRGGMETFIMNLYRKIDRNKIQFDFAVHGDAVGDFESEIKSLGGKIYRFPHMRKNPLKYKKAWNDFWKQNWEMYTAFHVHTNSLANTIALEEATKVTIPIRIIHSHSSMANKGKLQWLNDFLHKRHQKKIPQLATHLFSCSDKAAEWLFGAKSVDGKQVMQINNGIDPSIFAYDEEKRKTIREELGISNMKVIGHIGAFIPVKNHKFLIDVIEQAYKTDSAVRCVLIGSGELLEEVKNIVASKGLENVVKFLGVRADVNELLSSMDVFIMPSLYEGLPVSLIEVQANGLPAVISDTITRNVKLQENFYYLPLSDSPEVWAKKILKVIDSKERADNNDCIDEKGFNITNTVALYTKIIMEGDPNGTK